MCFDGLAIKEQFRENAKRSVSLEEKTAADHSWERNEHSTKLRCARDNPLPTKENDMPGIKWGMGGVNAIARGDSIHTSDGRKIRLSNIGSGIQLLVEDTYDEPSWEGWDVPFSKPIELSYSERIKAIPCNAMGRPDYNRDYWERKEIS